MILIRTEQPNKTRCINTSISQSKEYDNLTSLISIKYLNSDFSYSWEDAINPASSSRPDFEMTMRAGSAVAAKWKM